MSRNLGLLLLLLIASISWANAEEENNDEDPTVETLNGPIKGFKFKLPVIEREKTDIKSANIFLGIPYAAPPVKNLRFEVSLIF
jgi:hypothetical protein